MSQEETNGAAITTAKTTRNPQPTGVSCADCGSGIRSVTHSNLKGTTGLTLEPITIVMCRCGLSWDRTESVSDVVSKHVRERVARE